MRVALLALAALTLGGCVFQDVREQQRLIEATCTIEGTITTERPGTKPLVVVLVRPALSQPPWEIVDHFVLERPGSWAFVVAPGRYKLAAFEDANGDLIYQPGEPTLRIDAAPGVDCVSGKTAGKFALVIPEKGRGVDMQLDITALQARSVASQLTASLGQLTAVGEIAKLTDERFSEENAKSGLWKPFDFVVQFHPGIYFLEPYDASKVPVLFVHGINGTPQSFTYLIGKLDRRRYQPWIYYYPSGLRLDQVADHLAQTMAKVQVRHRVARFVVVAHSMGGLVSRAFIQRHAKSGTADLPLFVSVSSPYGGARSAELGVETAPAVVPVWYDMAPNSAFLREIFATPLPTRTSHHLLFTYSDTVVTVASQLAPSAQKDAARLYGFDDTHMGVLANPEVSRLLNQLLDQAR